MMWIKPVIMATVFTIASNTSPLKLSTLLVGMSALMFLWYQENSGTTWFSLIFFLMFMGGIIVVFMILSAIAPNQKSFKSNQKFMILALILIMPTVMCMHPNESFVSAMKWYMVNNANMTVSVIVILFYFFSFIYLVSKEKYPIR